MSDDLKPWETAAREIFHRGTDTPDLDPSHWWGYRNNREIIERACRAYAADIESKRPTIDAQAAAWRKTAEQESCNTAFYRGIVDMIGDLFDVEARTSDDGSIQDSVVALKVPELVEKLRNHRDMLRAEVVALDASSRTELNRAVVAEAKVRFIQAERDGALGCFHAADKERLAHVSAAHHMAACRALLNVADDETLYVAIEALLLSRQPRQPIADKAMIVPFDQPSDVKRAK